jgi:hypothetical protein
VARRVAAGHTWGLAQVVAFATMAVVVPARAMRHHLRSITDSPAILVNAGSGVNADLADAEATAHKPRTTIPPSRRLAGSGQHRHHHLTCGQATFRIRTRCWLAWQLMTLRLCGGPHGGC